MGSHWNFVCPWCGFEYRNLRTGYTYGDIYVLFWTNDSNQKEWNHKRRHTILGRWMELKWSQWQQHLEQCEAECEPPF